MMNSTKSERKVVSKREFSQAFSGCFHSQFGTGSWPQLSAFLTDIEGAVNSHETRRLALTLYHLTDKTRTSVPAVLTMYYRAMPRELMGLLGYILP